MVITQLCPRAGGSSTTRRTGVRATASMPAMHHTKLASIALALLVAACGGGGPGATSNTNGQPTSKPAGGGTAIDCDAMKAAAVELLGIQLLAQIKTPDTAASIKAKEIGNLDPDRMLGGPGDAARPRQRQHAPRRSEGRDRRLREGRPGRQGAVREGPDDPGRRRRLLPDRRHGGRVPGPPGRHLRGDVRGRLLALAQHCVTGRSSLGTGLSDRRPPNPRLGS